MLDCPIPVRLNATGTIKDSGGATVCVHGCVLTPAAALATAVIREGGGSGTIVLELQAAASGNSAVCNIRMGIKDPHVTLTGAGALFTAFI